MAHVAYRRLLAVGDCNTLGAGELRCHSYPERLAALLNAEVDNFGHTMATTREGLRILADKLRPEHDCVIMQFGLVDAYATFRFSPYVLYYPDNICRHVLRGLVKSYKKRCRRWGLNTILGQRPVVAEREYCRNMARMIDLCGQRQVILPEIMPNLDLARNPAIRQYNGLLQELAAGHSNALFIPLFTTFLASSENFYRDRTHASGPAYDWLAETIARALLGGGNGVTPVPNDLSGSVRGATGQLGS